MALGFNIDWFVIPDFIAANHFSAVAPNVFVNVQITARLPRPRLGLDIEKKGFEIADASTE
jgi:hypothetical protein